MKKMIKTFVKTVFTLAVTGLLLVTTSCKFGREILDLTDEAYITFDVSAARTVMPEFDTSNFSNFILSGTFHGEDPVILGSWNDLSTAKVTIKAGVWDFALTAKNGSAVLEGILLNKSISSGENVLSFNMNAVSYGSASSYGSLSVQLNVPETVQLVKAGLFTVDTEKPVADFGIQTLEVANRSVTYRKTIVPTGSYLVKFFMYGDEEGTVLLNEYSEVVIVASEAVSKGSETISDVNIPYTISYELGAGQLKAGAKCKSVYSILITTYLPSAEDLDYPDHVFLGWYEEEDFSGNAVTVIPAGSAYGNKKYYARWVTQGNYELPVGEIATKIHGLEAEGAYTIKALAGSLSVDIIRNIKTALLARKDIVVYLDFSATNGLLTLEDKAFENCTSLHSIVLPSSISTMGSAVFAGCSNLVEITIPFIGKDATTTTASATTLFGYIFGSTKYEGSVQISQGYSTGTAYYYIPSSLRKVNVLGGKVLYGAFYNCSMLTNISLADSITALGKYSFYNCTSLVEFYIPENVQTLDNYVFQKCTSLSKIHIPAAVTTFGTYVFDGDTSLTTVTFADNSELTTIGSYSFQNCSSVTRIDLTTTKVTAIKQSAFAGCTSLAAVNLDSGVLTTIDSSAFSNCVELTSVIVPSTVTAIGSAAFGGCTGLTSLTLPFIGSSATDYSYRANSTLFGYIFSGTQSAGCTQITQKYKSSSNSSSESSYSVYIPNGLNTVTITGAPADKKTVQQYAFNGCTLVPNIILKGGVLETYAFNGYTGLKTFEYKDASTPLPQYAFQNATNLTTVRITNPKEGFNKIDTSTFYGCKLLTDFVIPETVTTIGTSAFQYCEAYSNIVLPSKLTEIAGSAFYGCKSISNIVIPDSVTSIGSGAFAVCPGITKMTIPFTGTSAAAETGSNTSSFGYIFGTTSYTGGTAGTSYHMNDPATTVTGAGTYYYPSNLKEVVYTGTKLTSGAFSGAKTLTTVVLPDSITEIPNACFYGCSGLTSSPVKSTVTKIGKSAFYGCTGLTSVTIPTGVTELEAGVFESCTGMNSITIPANITTIRTNAFKNCTGFESIVIPDTVTAIETAILSGCIKLKELTIPFIGSGIRETASNSTTFGWIFGTTLVTGATATAQSYKSGTTAGTFCIPDTLTKVTVTGGNRFFGAFQNCKKLEEIILTDNVNFGTEEYAFDGCAELRSVRLPAATKMLGNYAFNKCSKLTTVRNTEQLKQLGDYAFADCTSLAEFTIPSGVTSLNSNVFKGCSSLTEIVIPASVTTIQTSAFAGCKGLTRIVIPETVRSIGASAFSGCSELAEMTIPFVGSTPDATTAANSTLFGYIFGTSSYTGGTAASQKCSASATTVSNYIPTKLKRVNVTGGNILYGAFSNCANIEMVNVDDEIYMIETDAFLNVPSVHYHGTAIGKPWGAKQMNKSVVVAVIPSTCVTHGTGNRVCAGCGDVLEENVEMELTEHSPDEEGNCTDCGGKIIYVVWEKNSGSYTQSGKTWSSPSIGHNASTTSKWVITIPEAVEYNFTARVSSESGYDKFSVIVDSTTIVNGISGSVTQDCKVNLSAGTHTITATYTKDGSNAIGSDKGYITLNDIIVVKQ